MILNFTDYTNVCCVGSSNKTISDTIRSVSDCENTVIIIAGDLHLGKNKFEDDVETLINLEYTIAKNNNYLIIIRGNNDNPKYFKKKSSFRNALSEDAPHIILVPDYSVIQTADHNILCIGGACSIDRSDPSKYLNYNYWKEEGVKKPNDSFYETLENENILIDVIVAHTAPLFAKPIEFSNTLKHYNTYLLNAYALYDKSIKNDIYKERLLLKGIYEKLNIKNHICTYVYSHFKKDMQYKYNKTDMISLDTLQKITL